MQVWSIAAASLLGTLFAVPAHSALHPHTAITPAAPIQLADAIAPPQALPQTLLGEYFEDWQIGEANFYQSSIIDSWEYTGQPADTQTEELYQTALRLTEQLLFNPYAQDLVSEERLFAFKDADLGLWGLDVSCQAECTSPVFRLDAEAFAAIAARTATTADDDFFRLMQDYYSYPPAINSGEVWGAPVFFQYTWDYGGYSLLGEGQHLKLLQQIDTYQQQHGDYLLASFTQTFALQIQQMRHQILRDILVLSDCSGPSWEAVLAELTLILDTVQLTTAEHTAIAERLALFESGRPDVQTGCEDPEKCVCGWG